MRRQSRDILAAEQHGAGLSPERAGNAVDQCGFSRTVRADQAETLSRMNIDADIVQGSKAAEAFGEAADPQQRQLRSGGHHASPPARLRPCRRIRPIRPSGAATTNSTSMAPSTST